MVGSVICSESLVVAACARKGSSSEGTGVTLQCSLSLRVPGVLLNCLLKPARSRKRSAARSVLSRLRRLKSTESVLSSKGMARVALST